MTSKVDILFVTDMSGSMAHLAQAVRDGFNDYINELRTKATNETEYTVTLTLFEGEAHRPLRWDSLQAVRRMDEEMYMPGGMTALLDAVGSTIEGYTGNAERVILLIQTDGHENSSRHYTYKQVTELLAAKEKEGWLVIFLGQGGEDVIRGAEKLGLSKANAIRYDASVTATRSTYGNLGQTTHDWMEMPADVAKTKEARVQVTNSTRERIDKEQGE